MQTTHCQWCDQSIYLGQNPYQIFFSHDVLCPKCRSLLKPVYASFQLEGCSGLTIYEYDQTIQDMLYQYKTMQDITLAPAFLPVSLLKLKLYIARRPLLMAPSSLNVMKERGFHTLDRMVKPLHPQILHPFYRLDQSQQKQRTYIQRQSIEIHIKPFQTISKKVILFDDVCITGSTLIACIHALKTIGITDIRILVLAKHLKHMVKP